MFTYEVRLFLRHMFYSFFKKQKEVPFNFRRVLFILFGLFGQHFFQFTVRISLLVESLLYFRYKKNYIKKPHFIIGNFRSGSTFLQNILTADEENFSSMQSWEIYFSPSLIQRWFYFGIAMFDKLIGAPFRRLIQNFENRTLKTVTVHRTGFFTPEEDEGLFSYTYSGLFVWFMFPFMEDLPPFHKFDTELSEKRKNAHMKFYKECVIRHMAFHRNSRFYLSKSPAFSSKVDSLLKIFPDARFIYLVRSPYQVIPSIMSWFTVVWGFFVESGARYPYKDYIIEMTKHFYTYTVEYLEKLPEDQYVIINYDTFVSNPKKVVKKLYSNFNLKMSEKYEKKLDELLEYEKNHQEANNLSLSRDGFTPEFIQKEFADVFEKFGFDKKGYKKYM